jgi:DNA-binding Xre family transcriptional regulator
MPISYNRLWKLLIDKELKKKDLRKLSGISTSTLAKIVKRKTISTKTIEKICKALNCKVEDILELII